jgi:hypothetical protein
MTPDPMDAIHKRNVEAGRVIGRRECESTHEALAGSFFDSGYGAGHDDAFWQGARVGVLVALLLVGAVWWRGRG